MLRATVRRRSSSHAVKTEREGERENEKGRERERGFSLVSSGYRVAALCAAKWPTFRRREVYRGIDRPVGMEASASRNEIAITPGKILYGRDVTPSVLGVARCVRACARDAHPSLPRLRAVAPL